MSELSKVEPGMTVVGADGVSVGVVVGVVEGRIKLESVTFGDAAPQNNFIPGGLVAQVEGNIVRLSPTGANAVLLDENEDGTMAD